MINKNSEITKNFIKLLFLKTHNEGFISCSLASIKNENNMQKIIDFINETPNANISMIEEQILKITGRI